MNKEKWIAQQIQELKDYWPQTSANDYCEPMLRQALKTGLAAPEFTEYRIVDINNCLVELSTESTTIFKIWYGKLEGINKHTALLLANRLKDMLE